MVEEEKLKLQIAEGIPSGLQLESAQVRKRCLVVNGVRYCIFFIYLKSLV